MAEGSVCEADPRRVVSDRFCLLRHRRGRLEDVFLRLGRCRRCPTGCHTANLVLVWPLYRSELLYILRPRTLTPASLEAYHILGAEYIVAIEQSYKAA